MTDILTGMLPSFNDAMGFLGIGGQETDTSGSMNQNMQQIVEMLQSISSNSTTNQQSSTTQQQLAEIIQSLSSSQNQQTINLGEEDIGALRDSLAAITQEVNRTITADYSQEEAGAIFEQARSAAVDRVLQAGMDEVLAAGSNAGAYDSTVQRDVAQDLATRAATAGTEAEAALRTEFGQLNVAQSGQLSSTMTQLFDVLRGAVSETQTEATQQSESSQETTGSSQTDSSQKTKSNQTTQTTQETDTDTNTDSSSGSDSSNTGIIDEIGDFLGGLF